VGYFFSLAIGKSSNPYKKFMKKNNGHTSLKDCRYDLTCTFSQDVF